jgi:hypothetical protein
VPSVSRNKYLSFRTKILYDFFISYVLQTLLLETQRTLSFQLSQSGRHISVGIYRVSQEESSISWEAIVLSILSKNVYTYMYHIPNCFRDRVISLYSSNILDKKEILRTVYNTGIYCSSDKFRTVYLVQYILQNSTVNINALCNSFEGTACCASVLCTVQWNISISETGIG